MDRDIIMNYCENCIHKQVCKHKEEYQEAARNICNEAAVYEDICDISVRCKFFDVSKPLFR